jgi:hypothetical protein
MNQSTLDFHRDAFYELLRAFQNCVMIITVEDAPDFHKL